MKIPKVLRVIALITCTIFTCTTVAQSAPVQPMELIKGLNDANTRSVSVSGAPTEDFAPMPKVQHMISEMAKNPASAKSFAESLATLEHGIDTAALQEVLASAEGDTDALAKDITDLLTVAVLELRYKMNIEGKRTDSQEITRDALARLREIADSEEYSQKVKTAAKKAIAGLPKKETVTLRSGFNRMASQPVDDFSLPSMTPSDKTPTMRGKDVDTVLNRTLGVLCAWLIGTTLWVRGYLGDTVSHGTYGSFLMHVFLPLFYFNGSYLYLILTSFYNKEDVLARPGVSPYHPDYVGYVPWHMKPIVRYHEMRHHQMGFKGKSEDDFLRQDNRINWELGFLAGLTPIIFFCVDIVLWFFPNKFTPLFVFHVAGDPSNHDYYIFCKKKLVANLSIDEQWYLHNIMKQFVAEKVGAKNEGISPAELHITDITEADGLKKVMFTAAGKGYEIVYVSGNNGLSRNNESILHEAEVLDTVSREYLVMAGTAFNKKPSSQTGEKQAFWIAARDGALATINDELADIYYPAYMGEGETLSENMRTSGKPFSKEQTVRIGIQLAKLMQYFNDHDVIVLAIHPDNIVLCRDGRVRLRTLAASALMKKYPCINDRTYLHKIYGLYRNHFGQTYWPGRGVDSFGTGAPTQGADVEALGHIMDFMLGHKDSQDLMRPNPMTPLNAVIFQMRSYEYFYGNVSAARMDLQRLVSSDQDEMPLAYMYWQRKMEKKSAEDAATTLDALVSPVNPSSALTRIVDMCRGVQSLVAAAKDSSRSVHERALAIELVAVKAADGEYIEALETLSVYFSEQPVTKENTYLAQVAARVNKESDNAMIRRILELLGTRVDSAPLAWRNHSEGFVYAGDLLSSYFFRTRQVVDGESPFYCSQRTFFPELIGYAYGIAAVDHRGRFDDVGYLRWDDKAYDADIRRELQQRYATSTKAEIRIVAEYVLLFLEIRKKRLELFFDRLSALGDAEALKQYCGDHSGVEGSVVQDDINAMASERACRLHARQVQEEIRLHSAIERGETDLVRFLAVHSKFAAIRNAAAKAMQNEKSAQEPTMTSIDAWLSAGIAALLSCGALAISRYVAGFMVIDPLWSSLWQVITNADPVLIGLWLGVQLFFLYFVVSSVGLIALEVYAEGLTPYKNVIIAHPGNDIYHPDYQINVPWFLKPFVRYHEMRHHRMGFYNKTNAEVKRQDWRIALELAALAPLTPIIFRFIDRRVNKNRVKTGACKDPASFSESEPLFTYEALKVVGKLILLTVACGLLIASVMFFSSFAHGATGAGQDVSGWGFLSYFFDSIVPIVFASLFLLWVFGCYESALWQKEVEFFEKGIAFVFLVDEKEVERYVFRCSWVSEEDRPSAVREQVDSKIIERALTFMKFAYLSMHNDIREHARKDLRRKLKSLDRELQEDSSRLLSPLYYYLSEQNSDAADKGNRISNYYFLQAIVAFSLVVFPVTWMPLPLASALMCVLWICGAFLNAKVYRRSPLYVKNEVVRPFLWVGSQVSGEQYAVMKDRKKILRFFDAVFLGVFMYKLLHHIFPDVSGSVLMVGIFLCMVLMRVVLYGVDRIGESKNVRFIPASFSSEADNDQGSSPLNDDGFTSPVSVFVMTVSVVIISMLIPSVLSAATGAVSSSGTSIPSILGIAAIVISLLIQGGEWGKNKYGFLITKERVTARLKELYAVVHNSEDEDAILAALDNFTAQVRMYNNTHITAYAAAELRHLLDMARRMTKNKKISRRGAVLSRFAADVRNDALQKVCLNIRQSEVVRKAIEQAIVILDPSEKMKKTIESFKDTNKEVYNHHSVATTFASLPGSEETEARIEQGMRAWIDIFEKVDFSPLNGLDDAEYMALLDHDEILVRLAMWEYWRQQSDDVRKQRYAEIYANKRLRALLPFVPPVKYSGMSMDMLKVQHFDKKRSDALSSQPDKSAASTFGVQQTSMYTPKKMRELEDANSYLFDSAVDEVYADCLKPQDPAVRPTMDALLDSLGALVDGEVKISPIPTENRLVLCGTLIHEFVHAYFISEEGSVLLTRYGVAEADQSAVVELIATVIELRYMLVKGDAYDTSEGRAAGSHFAEAVAWLRTTDAVQTDHLKHMINHFSEHRGTNLEKLTAQILPFIKNRYGMKSETIPQGLVKGIEDSLVAAQEGMTMSDRIERIQDQVLSAQVAASKDAYATYASLCDRVAEIKVVEKPAVVMTHALDMERDKEWLLTMLNGGVVVYQFNPAEHVAYEWVLSENGVVEPIVVCNGTLSHTLTFVKVEENISDIKVVSRDEALLVDEVVSRHADVLAVSMNTAERLSFGNGVSIDTVIAAFTAQLNDDQIQEKCEGANRMFIRSSKRTKLVRFNPEFVANCGTSLMDGYGKVVSAIKSALREVVAMRQIRSAA